MAPPEKGRDSAPPRFEVTASLDRTGPWTAPAGARVAPGPLDVRQRPGARSIVRRIRHALCSPYETEAGVARIGASAGIAMFPEDGRSPEALLAAADEDMYRAKRGRGD